MKNNVFWVQILRGQTGVELLRGIRRILGCSMPLCVARMSGERFAYDAGESDFLDTPMGKLLTNLGVSYNLTDSE